MRIAPTLLLPLLAVCLADGTGGHAETPERFLIFPLENQDKTPGLAWVGEGVAISVSDAMLVPGVETVSWEERARFIESVDLPHGTPLSRASMIRVAQRAAASRMVFGSYSEAEGVLKITLRSLDLQSLKLGREITVSGPLESLPRLENDLAWAILGDTVPDALPARAEFSLRTRKIPNEPYADFIYCLAMTDSARRAAALEGVLARHREFPQAAFVLGSQYFETGDCTRAIPYLKSAVNDEQSSLEAQFMLGTCHLRQSNLTGAIAAYEAFLTGCRALEAFNNLGVAYLRKREYPRAEQNFLEARKLAKADLTVDLNLAVLYYLRKNTAAALGVLDPLLQEYPEQGTLHFLYGSILEIRGDKEKAEAGMARARQLGVDTEKLKRQGAQLWTRIFPGWLRRPVPAITGPGRSARR